MSSFATPFNRIGISLLDFCLNGEKPDGATYFDDVLRRAIAAVGESNGLNGRVLQVPRGTYKFARQVNLEAQVTLIGESTAFGDSGNGTKFVFDAGNNGIVWHRPNTCLSGRRNDGAIVSGIDVQGAAGSGTHHGLVFYTRGLFERGCIRGFDGDGIHIACVVPVSNDWVGSTAYTVGQTRYNNYRLYIVTANGTSAASGGPTGTGTGITDGSVTWDYVSTYAGLIEPLDTIPAWAALTAYKIGDAMTSDTGRCYLCVQEGVSSDLAPTGTGAGIVDGTCKWNYINGTNANGWQVDLVRIDACRNAIYTVGGDSNSGCMSRFDIVACTSWGIHDASFLGNVYRDGQISGCAAGGYTVTNPNAAVSFRDVYLEQDQPGCTITNRTIVTGALQAAGFTAPNNGFVQDGNRVNGLKFAVNGVGDEITMGGASLQSIKNYSLDSYLKKVSFDGTPTGLKGVVAWNWANLANWYGHGQALDGQSLFQAGSELARYMAPTQFWAGLGFGIIVEGKRISFCDSVTRPALGFGGSVTDAPGDVIFKRAPVAGESPGWVCTVGGTSSAYTEGLTATSAGGTSLTLSGNTALASGLQIGDRVQINGVDTYVTNRGLGATNSITVADAIPAGSGFAITYVPGTWVPMPALTGGAADSTGTPGAATQNTRKGRAAIAIGAAAVTITNSLVTATSIIGVALQSNDATLTQILRVVPGSGSFVITGNANATAAANVAWWLIE